MYKGLGVYRASHGACGGARGGPRGFRTAHLQDLGFRVFGIQGFGFWFSGFGFRVEG
jgi:hypothetical protein